MKSFFIVILAFSAFACNKIRKDKLTIIEKDGLVIKGYQINDSTYDDTVYYFDLNERLRRKEFFKNGEKEGPCFEYYTNGKIRKVTNYNNGLRNGMNLYFDSSGKRIYQDFYYHDLPVGPVVYFDENNNPKKYFFVSFDNNDLMYIDYQNWTGLSNEIILQAIHFSNNLQKNDTTVRVSLFIYLPTPPKLNVDYKIVKKKKGLDEQHFTIIERINSDMPFKNLFLPVLSNEEHYSLQVNIYDSILNKKVTVFKDIL